MPVERAQFINQLNELNPQPFNMIKEGDDHIRLTKGCTKNTFPRFDRKIDFSAEQLNKLYSWIMAIEDATDEEVKESLNRFTVLEDMEIRRDLFFTEGGEDGTSESTPESPKISGLSDISFTTDEENDPDLISKEKSSRALNLRTADKRYLFKTSEDGILGGVSKLVFKDGEEYKDVAVATEGVLTVKGKVIADSLAGPDDISLKLDFAEGKGTFKDIEIGQDLRVTGNIFRGSDINLKWDVQSLASEVTIDKLVPVQYRKAGRKEFGVIAQEIQELPHYEHLVTSGFNGVLGVDYIQFIPVLIKEVQDLKAENLDLKEQLRNIDSGTADSFEDVSKDIQELQNRIDKLDPPETKGVVDGN